MTGRFQKIILTVLCAIIFNTGDAHSAWFGSNSKKASSLEGKYELGGLVNYEIQHQTEDTHGIEATIEMNLTYITFGRYFKKNIVGGISLDYLSTVEKRKGVPDDSLATWRILMPFAKYMFEAKDKFTPFLGAKYLLYEQNSGGAVKSYSGYGAFAGVDYSLTNNVRISLEYHRNTLDIEGAKFNYEKVYVPIKVLFNL